MSPFSFMGGSLYACLPESAKSLSGLLAAPHLHEVLAEAASDVLERCSTCVLSALVFIICYSRVHQSRVVVKVTSRSECTRAQTSAASVMHIPLRSCAFPAADDLCNQPPSRTFLVFRQQDFAKKIYFYRIWTTRHVFIIVIFSSAYVQKCDDACVLSWKRVSV
jgi:hypothetical protein